MSAYHGWKQNYSPRRGTNPVRPGVTEEPKVLSPTRQARRTAVLAFIGDRGGQIRLDGTTFGELRQRGLTRSRLEQTIEELAADRMLILRNLWDRIIVSTPARVAAERRAE